MKANEDYSKAVEFVKKYGIDKAKELVSSIINTISVNGYVCDPCFITDDGEYVGYNDLKRYVDSYELVESYGGLEKAKLRCYPAKHLTMESYYKLKQAISDVEECQ